LKVRLVFGGAEMSSFVLHHRSRRVPLVSRQSTEPVILHTLFGEGYGLYKTQRRTFLRKCQSKHTVDRLNPEPA